MMADYDDWNDDLTAEFEAELLGKISDKPTSRLPETIADIYSYLALGEKLRLTFPDEQTKERFRLALAQYKMKLDQRALSVGMISEEQVEALSCIRDKSAPNSFIYNVFFSANKRVRGKYFSVIEVISDDSSQTAK